MQTTNTVSRRVYLPEAWIIDVEAVRNNMEAVYNISLGAPALLDELHQLAEPEVVGTLLGTGIEFLEENVVEITFDDASRRFHGNDYSVYLKGKGIVVGEQFVLKRITGFYTMPAERLL